MTISAQVVAHSRSPFHVKPYGVKDITTFLLRYPRFIHSEVMTHRVFSRNASSSRAIPVKRMIQDVIDDTAIPIHWGKNQKGMQAREEHNSIVDVPVFSMRDPKAIKTEGGILIDAPYDRVHALMDREKAWLEARDRAVEIAQSFADAEYHKQVVNRLLEPFMHINVVVTATNFDNFYWLRAHPDAQPEIKALAEAMLQAHSESTPRLLGEDEWHVPFVTEEDRNRVFFHDGGHGNVLESEVTQTDLLQVSTARSARTSYMTHDGRTPDFEEDLALYQRLVGGEPLHASPTEHQAKPDKPHYAQFSFLKEHLRGNLDPGWIQFRKTLPREFCTNYAEWTAA